MTRVLSLIFAALIVFSMASCGAQNEDGGIDLSFSGNTAAKVKETLLFEKSYDIAEGKSVALKFFGQDGGLVSIEYSLNGAEPAKLSVSEATARVLGSEKPAESDDPEFRFFTKDMNFDGFPDFAVQSWKSEGAIPYYCWLWNAGDETFSFGAELENPMFDKSNSKIYCETSDGGKDCLTVYNVSGGTIVVSSSVEIPSDLSFATDLSSYEQYMEPENRDGYLILANKETALGEDYIPEDLTEIANTRQDRAAQRMVGCAAKALDALYIELYAAGYTDVTVTSAYRSFADQKTIFDGFYNQNLAAGYDEDTALAMVLSDTAYPGTSEHQTGLCCDMHNYPTATQDFKNEDAYRWLTDNAWKFGFILRYPEDKVDITGYTFEPWHYRFVGRYHAARIHALGLCLEEYLALIGK